MQESKRKKTSVAKKDDTPQYQESFNFRTEPEELDQTSLRVTCIQHQPLLERGITKTRCFSAMDDKVIYILNT